jgi:hypothetical protein
MNDAEVVAPVVGQFVRRVKTGLRGGSVASCTRACDDYGGLFPGVDGHMRGWLGWMVLVGCGGADTFLVDAGADGNMMMGDAVAMNDGGDGGGGCMMGMTSCNGTCVSTQSDPKNCGGCGIDCTGGSCSNGICNLLPADAGMPPAVDDFACITVDSTYVYVATGMPNGMVYKVPLNGGPWSPVATAQGGPHGVKSNGQWVYWTNVQTGQIMRADPNGMNVKTLVQNQLSPIFLTLDSTYVFWINNGDGSIWRAGLDGSNPTKLFDGYGAMHSGMITNAGPWVFWASSSNGVIGAVAKDNNNPAMAVMLAQNQARPFSIETDGSSLYWGNRGNTQMGQGSIQKLSMMNPGTPQPIATMQTNPHGISTDGQNVYWSNAAMAGTINKVSTMGGQVTTLATNQTWPDCTAVDSKSVYWINTGGSMVSKTAK